MTRGLADKLTVIMRRDLLTALRYRGGFGLQLLSIVAEVAAFYFLARAIGPGYRPDGMGYFGFLLVGTGFYAFLLTGMTVFVESVREAQITGTMEFLMTTATPGPTVILLSAFSAFSTRAAQFAFTLLLGFALFGVNAGGVNVGGCVLVFLLSLVVAIAIGMTMAAIQVVIYKGRSIVWLLSAIAGLMTGTMFPVSALPKPLLAIARVIPITYSLDGMRIALLRGGSYVELSRPLGVLSAYAVLLLPASLWLLSWSLRVARRNGTLSAY